MNIADIYRQYSTPQNLQEHMLRVAGLGQILVSAWTGPQIDNTAIIHTLLLHDIAKPIAFNIKKQKRFVTSGEEYQEVIANQQIMIEKYGTNEHQAAHLIFVELGLGEKAVHLVDNLEWHCIDHLLTKEDYESLICIYCDMRIGPKGILTIEDRLIELNRREPILNLEERLRSAGRLEELMMANTSFDLHTVTDQQIEEQFAELRKLM